MTTLNDNVLDLIFEKRNSILINEINNKISEIVPKYDISDINYATVLRPFGNKSTLSLWCRECGEKCEIIHSSWELWDDETRLYSYRRRYQCINCFNNMGFSDTINYIRLPTYMQRQDLPLLPKTYHSCQTQL